MEGFAKHTGEHLKIVLLQRKCTLVSRIKKCIAKKKWKVYFLFIISIALKIF